MAVDEGRPGRAGGRVVVEPGALDVRPVAIGRRVVEGERQPRAAGDQRPDRREAQERGDAIGPLAGRRDGGVAGAELVAQPGRPDPGGDGPPAAGQDGPEEQEDEPRGGSAVEGGGEAREPLARSAVSVRGCHGRLGAG
jgi:hypothetical protein